MDPTKRYTTLQVLQHPWLNHDVSDAPLIGTLGQLKMFNARRKLKAGMNAVRSAVRVRMLLNALKNPSTVVRATLRARLRRAAVVLFTAWSAVAGCCDWC